MLKGGYVLIVLGILFALILLSRLVQCLIKDKITKQIKHPNWHIAFNITQLISFGFLSSLITINNIMKVPHFQDINRDKLDVIYDEVIYNAFIKGIQIDLYQWVFYGLLSCITIFGLQALMNEISKENSQSQAGAGPISLAGTEPASPAGTEPASTPDNT